MYGTVINVYSGGQRHRNVVGPLSILIYCYVILSCFDLTSAKLYIVRPLC